MLTKHPQHGTYHAHKQAVAYSDVFSAALAFVNPFKVQKTRQQLECDRVSTANIPDYF